MANSWLKDGPLGPLAHLPALQLQDALNWLVVLTSTQAKRR